MKFLKISFFACLFLFALNLSAQRPGGGPGQLPNLDSMRVKLSLSADQETKIKGVISTYRPKLKEARAGAAERERHAGHRSGDRLHGAAAAWQTGVGSRAFHLLR